MGLRAERRSPLYVPAGFGIKGFGQMLFFRHHVAGPGLSPLRLVRARRVEHSNNHAASQPPDPSSIAPGEMAAGEAKQIPPAASPAGFHWEQVDREPEQASINKKSLGWSRSRCHSLHDRAPTGGEGARRTVQGADRSSGW